MPKKVKEEAEWVDDEVAPAAGEIKLMLSEKLARRLGSVTANVNVNVAVVRRRRLHQTPLEIINFNTYPLIGNGVYLVINEDNFFMNR